MVDNMVATNIQSLFEASAAQFPNNIAVVEPGCGEISYAALDSASASLRDYLVHNGVQPNDRVGFCLPKSIDSIVAMYGILRSGAAYVPVDTTAPASRNAYIFSHCEVKTVIVHESLVAALTEELAAFDGSTELIVVPNSDQPGALVLLLAELQADKGYAVAATHNSQLQDLAYILYTSGSTGRPKGVMLTHENGLSFLDWCTESFEIKDNDRCSSHAPLHFDLSILDIHLPLKHGAAIILIAEKVGKEAASLAPLIAEQKISSWYSAPSILALLAQHGELETFDYSALRQILFAGEVFPVKHLRLLQQLLPKPKYFNLYGPTETNVCTYYEVIETVPEDRTQPYPIGPCCSHLESLVVDPNGVKVATGETGELVIRGPGVTQGYWDLPEQTANAFLDVEGGGWYRTGDLVCEDTEGNYEFLGRRDRMVKKRGYRIELDEIEACLYQHDDIKEVGVIAIPDEETGIKVTAFVSSGGEKRLSVIALKVFCSKRLPTYMVPDVFNIQPQLPRTSTDKVDYQSLKQM